MQTKHLGNHMPWMQRTNPKIQNHNREVDFYSDKEIE